MTDRNRDLPSAAREYASAARSLPYTSTLGVTLPSPARRSASARCWTPLCAEPRICSRCITTCMLVTENSSNAIPIITTVPRGRTPPHGVHHGRVRAVGGQQHVGPARGAQLLVAGHDRVGAEPEREVDLVRGPRDRDDLQTERLGVLQGEVA